MKRHAASHRILKAVCIIILIIILAGIAIRFLKSRNHDTIIPELHFDSYEEIIFDLD